MSYVRGRSCLLVLGLLAALLGSAVLTSTAPPASAAAYDRDCTDFSTQRAAQLFFLDHSPRSDPHLLDSDGDLVACETNPCPCVSDTSGSGGTAAGSTPLRQRARVVAVTDGDTIRVRLATGPLRDVRLVGIDTPEVYGGAECGGPEASRSLRQILPRGTRVSLVSDPSQALKDRYGRLLRYVHLVATGSDVNRRQVSRGWARVYVYANVPFRRVSSYRTAQSTAVAAGRGIWGRC